MHVLGASEKKLIDHIPIFLLASSGKCWYPAMHRYHAILLKYRVQIKYAKDMMNLHRCWLMLAVNRLINYPGRVE